MDLFRISLLIFGGSFLALLFLYLATRLTTAAYYKSKQQCNKRQK